MNKKVARQNIQKIVIVKQQFIGQIIKKNKLGFRIYFPGIVTYNRGPYLISFQFKAHPLIRELNVNEYVSVRYISEIKLGNVYVIKRIIKPYELEPCELEPYESFNLGEHLDI